MSISAAASVGRASRGLLLGLMWVVASRPLSGCTLLAPNDDHYTSDPARVPAQSEGGESGRAHGVGGASSDHAEGGANALAGNSRGGAGAGASGSGEAGAQNAGSAGLGDCGKASACGWDETCERGQCISVTGCSDGTREAFLPISRWPTIAGCTAKWPRSSLRAAKTGSACGYETNLCTVPADACGTGWHVCASPPYGPSEISSQATEAECAIQPGAFVAAVGDQFCEPCSADGDGAACCGERCVQQYGSCIYPGMTAWFGVVDDFFNACGDIQSDLVQAGVLCCRAP